MKALFALALFALPLSPAHADHPSVHGMLLFGNEKIYVSHLPMFHSPHDYQLLAELELPASAMAAYKKAQAQKPEESVYTLVPESFVLPEMVAKPKAFSASLVQGHFERGGNTIVGKVTVKLGKILHFRKFDPMAAKPAQATYLWFGNSQESFVAHFITTKPDFDHVAQVKGSGPAEAELLTTNKGNGQPLKDGFHSFLKEAGGSLSLELEKTLYFETGDLAH